MALKLQRQKDAGEEYQEEHIHSVQKVAPSGAIPVALVAGAGLWTLGDFSADILADAFVTHPFDLHWAMINDPDANGHYEVVLYYGAGDTECARVAFTRAAVFDSSFAFPVLTPVLPAGSRVRAKLMGSVAGIGCGIKVFYHEY